VSVDEQALTASLQALLRRLDLPPDVPERGLMHRLGEGVSAAAQVLAVDGVGLMLLDDRDVLRVVGATDETGRALELAQVELGVGPAIDSRRTGRSVAVDDLAAGTEYRVLADRLASRDGSGPLPGGGAIRGVLSVAVQVRGEVVGTLNGIRARPGPWTPAEVRAVEAYAGIIAVLLRLGLPADGHVGSALRTLGRG